MFAGIVNINVPDTDAGTKFTGIAAMVVLDDTPLIIGVITQLVPSTTALQEIFGDVLNAVNVKFDQETLDTYVHIS